MNPALVAEALKLPIVAFQPLPILSADLPAPLEVYLGLALAVDQRQCAARKRGIDLLPAQHLDHGDIEVEGAQEIQSLTVRKGGHEKIGDDDRLAGPAYSLQVLSQGRGDFQLSSREDRGNKINALRDPMAAAVERRTRSGGTSLQEMELHMVMIGQDHVGKREGDVAGWRELFSRRRKGHRAAGVDKQIGEEIHLFAKELHVEAVATGKDSPIDVADVVARRISPVVRELETRPPARRRVASRPAAQDLLARADPECLKAI